MTIPPMDPILDAVRNVRAAWVDAAELGADILDGDDRALAVGRELVAAIDQLREDLESLTGGELDGAGIIEQLIGVEEVVDAVLVATGEQDSAAPTVSARFKAERLERHRRWYERAFDDLLAVRRARPLIAVETSFLDQCEHDLDLISAGIEPA